MKKHLKQTFAATAIIAGVIGTASLAIADNDKADFQQLASSQIQLNEAVTIATKTVPGKVFEAELELEDDKAVWEIEVLSENNELFEIEIDANSGEILSQELDEHKKA